MERDGILSGPRVCQSPALLFARFATPFVVDLHCGLDCRRPSPHTSGLPRRRHGRLRDKGMSAIGVSCKYVLPSEFAAHPQANSWRGSRSLVLQPAMPLESLLRSLIRSGRIPHLHTNPVSFKTQSLFRAERKRCISIAASSLVRRLYPTRGRLGVGFGQNTVLLPTCPYFSFLLPIHCFPRIEPVKFVVSLAETPEDLASPCRLVYSDRQPACCFFRNPHNPPCSSRQILKQHHRAVSQCPSCLRRVAVAAAVPPRS